MQAVSRLESPDPDVITEKAHLFVYAVTWYYFFKCTFWCKKLDPLGPIFTPEHSIVHTDIFKVMQSILFWPLYFSGLFFICTLLLLRHNWHTLYNWHFLYNWRLFLSTIFATWSQQVETLLSISLLFSPSISSLLSISSFGLMGSGLKIDRWDPAGFELRTSWSPSECAIH